MKSFTIVTQLTVALAALNLAACKEDSGHKKGAPAVKTADVSPKSLIARVPVNPKTPSEAKIQFVTSNQELKGASTTDVEAAFNSGNTMNIQSEGNVVYANDAQTGQSFSLFGCENYTNQNPYGQPVYQPTPTNGYQPYGYGQPYNAQPYPPLPNNGNSGGIFDSLLGGLGMGNLGIGSLFGNLLPSSGMFSQLLSVFQNGAGLGSLFQRGMQPTALPIGQNINSALCNTLGYGAPNSYPTMPGQSYTPGYGNVPYGYNGQYQTAPYNYYTYGQVPTYGPVPTYGQTPVYGQYPSGNQPYPYSTTPTTTYPQTGTNPPTYAPNGTYTPYPTGG